MRTDGPNLFQHSFSNGRGVAKGRREATSSDSAKGLGGLSKHTLAHPFISNMQGRLKVLWRDVCGKVSAGP